MSTKTYQNRHELVAELIGLLRAHGFDANELYINPADGPYTAQELRFYRLYGLKSCNFSEEVKQGDVYVGQFN